jgi:cell division septation protein DedD
MARPPRQGYASPRESLAFWLVVLLIATVVGLLSYRVGRDWLGKRMAGLATSGGAPRIIAQSSSDLDPDAQAEAEAKAPKKAEASLEDREPTEGEKRQLEADGSLEEPQDGAQANARAADAADGGEPAAAADGEKAADTGDDLSDAERPRGGGKLVVVAGSYADRANAERVMRKLADRGYQPYLETVRKGGKAYQRVNVATVESRSEAEDLQAELAGEGVEASISTARH